MPLIHFKALAGYLKKVTGQKNVNDLLPMTLIHGDESLCNSALKDLVGALVPESTQDVNYEVLEGVNENIPDAIEKVTTFSLLPANRVVTISDSDIFQSKQDKDRILERVKTAVEKNDFKTAANHFLKLLGLLNLCFEDMAGGTWDQVLKIKSTKKNQNEWIEKVITYCTQNDLTIPAYEDPGGFLEEKIKKGFPRGNFLIITTNQVDKRKALYKTINDHGLIIDCSVPTGNRMADKKIRESILYERMQVLLKNSGKSMEKKVFLALCQMTGFDIRTFSKNIEKLVSYVGDKADITLSDIENVIERTKQDPIFDFTGAIADKNPVAALFYLDSLLSLGFHPLQLLAALTNQIRKLLLAKGFLKKQKEIGWYESVTYDMFRKNIMPAVRLYDNALLNEYEIWEKMADNNKTAHQKRAKKKTQKPKRQIKTDLLLAKNPNNPYPVFLLIKKAEKFSQKQLIVSMNEIFKADQKLKTSATNPKIVMERLVWVVCQN